MIKIETNIGDYLNEFKVSLDPELQLIHRDKLKVKFYHFPLEDESIDLIENSNWEIDLQPGTWATWKSGGCNRCDIRVFTQEGKHLFTRKWNGFIDGGKIEKALNLYCKINQNSRGIIIGSHDGEWGHWVDPVREMGIECLIIEGSEKQYNRLKKNYSRYSNCTLLNHIVTVNGEDVTWYYTEEGYSDSVIKGISEKFNDISNVFNKVEKSKSINEIIKTYGYENFDFLHLDLEGYDTDLIMGLLYFPKIIIFENEHCKSEGKYNEAINFLLEKGYNIIEEDIDTLAIKLN